jgi:multidrug resistance protein, MATE family
MNHFIRDIRSTLALGVPLIIAQLCLMAMALTDAVMVGRGAGTESLAAMALALGYMNIPCVAMSGFSNVTSIFVADAFGSGRTKETPAILRHGLLVSLVVSVLVLGFMCWFFNHLECVGYFGQSKSLITMARPFVYLYAVAFVFQLCSTNFRAYCEAQNRPWLSIYVIGGSIALNAALDWVFVFGRCGVPAMGLVGAGLATLLSSAIQFFVLVCVILHTKSLHLVLGEFVRLDFARARIVRYLRLSLPTAFQIGIEMASYTVLAFIAGRLGAVTLAAHLVAFQVASFAFMVPLGMSFAVAIRVSQAAGAGDRAGVRRVSRSALAFAVGWMSMSMIAILALHNYIPYLFTADPEVVKMSAGFLIVAGVFQLFDGIQCTAIGALRGLKDVYKPTILVIAIYWMCEIPLAFFLAFRTDLGGLGVWLAMMCALMLSAAFLALRLRRIVA